MAVLPDVLTANVAAGAPAVMATEYMPGGDGAQIINPATSGTIYVGTSSGVGSSNGVPVPAGASVQWTQAGQLWAVAGPDFSTGQTTTLIVSQCINQWTPSPEAVATATADQLLTQGIPQVFRGAIIYIGTAAAFPTDGIDVSQYASLNVRVTPDGAAGAVGYLFSDPESGAVLDENYLTNYDKTLAVTFRLPVSGPQLHMNAVTGTPSLVIYGSNRTVPAGSVNQPNQAKLFNTGAVTMTNGSYYTLTDENGYSQSVYNGLVVCRARVTGAYPKGRLIFNAINSNGVGFQFVEYSTYEMTQQGSATDVAGTFQFAHPRGAGYWQFLYEGTTGAATQAVLSVGGA